jgi:hypothetical protein
MVLLFKIDRRLDILTSLELDSQLAAHSEVPTEWLLAALEKMASFRRE